MPDGLKERVQARLDALGKGPVEAATAANLERTYIRDIVTGKKKTVSANKLPALAEALNTSVEYLTLATNDPAPQARAVDHVRQLETKPDVDLSRAEAAPPLQRFGGPRDVPVYGTAIGGGNEDGDFRFNGEQIDMAPRPPGIANRKDVFCLYVENDSMFPKFEPGDRLYIDPHRRPRIGEYVVVELHGESEDEPGKGFIKRLVKQTPLRLIVSQFNPPKELGFEAGEVKRLLRVIPVDELLGV